MTWRQNLSRDTSTIESSEIPDSTAAADILTEISNRSADDDEQTKDSSDSDLPWKIKFIDPKQAIHTSFFSSSSLETLFNTIIVFSKKLTNDIKVSKRSYKITLWMTKKNKIGELDWLTV